MTHQEIQDIRDRYVNAIRSSGLSIYDPINIEFHGLWIPDTELELILSNALVNTSLAGMALKTRSKFLKILVCNILGYEPPSSFRKSQPRFIGQDFDTYIQKSNNFQVWNEMLSPSRRYVIVRLDGNDLISKVRVLTGEILMELDKTGTLTAKYQAIVKPREEGAYLLSPNDNGPLSALSSESLSLPADCNPSAPPERNQLLSIETIFRQLKSIVGISIPYHGSDQERARATELQKVICQKLGYGLHVEDGQFPDIPHQLLEVKLQTSKTIDLGKHRPDSGEDSRIRVAGSDATIRFCDMRYAIVCGQLVGDTVRITHLLLVTGADFTKHFQLMQGKVVNKKLQIPLPPALFDE